MDHPYTGRGSSYVNKEMGHLFTLMETRHPLEQHSPWTNGLVEVHNRNLGTHLRMILLTSSYASLVLRYYVILFSLVNL